MDYANGKIYQITNIDHTKCYIGSTTHSLSRRFSKHKAHYKMWQEGKFGKCTVFDLFNEYGVDNCYIDLVEAFGCKNRTELERKEGEFIKNTDCINKNIAGRTDKEYRTDNKQKISEYQKEYYVDKKENKKQYYIYNKQKLLEHYNCECGKQYSNVNKARHIKSDIHKNYIKNNIKTISKLAFNRIFECDSLSLVPATYPNYIISN
ncbi:MAG: GIY-YIG nuclease family protein [Bacteroidetes bacterium]|nr:GIY-YIG nuclease family protein [Bacteroidota bacterium]